METFLFGGVFISNTLFVIKERELLTIFTNVGSGKNNFLNYM